MDDIDSAPQPDQPPSLKSAAGSSPPVLSYRAVMGGGTVLVGRYPSAMAAALPAAQLEAEGIFCEVSNTNVNALGPYSGMADVTLYVHEKDADAAREILSRSDDDLEPVDDPPDAPPVIGEDGAPINLVTVAAYEKLRDFRDAAAVLASAQVRVFPPALRSRGDQPAGEGKRFLLKVGAEDRERAELFLEQDRAEIEADDEPRCPKCNSWRVFPVSQFWQSLKASFGMGTRPAEQIECLACRHRGSPEAFGVKK
jgi:hypothetical protein